MQVTAFVRSIAFKLVALIVALHFACSARCQMPLPPVEDSLSRDYSQQLARFEPRSPAEGLASIEVAADFELTLVASEPLVVDPIAFAFDAANRLFVVEMRGYSEQAEDNLGRVACLVDSDSDGVFDTRTTFVDGLSWPTAVWPWKTGVLVAHAPYLSFFDDTDNDGVSDQREDWFTGFGKGNVQGLVNSLTWNVDSRIHGATSSSGAEIVQLKSAGGKPTSLSGRDFVIDPMTKSLRAATGGGQHGLSFNAWGDKFVTSNSDHLQQVLDLEPWLATRASKLAIPRLRRSIAEDGPQAEVYRSSPVEPWRIVRTRLRMQGLVPGPVEGGGRPAGYFTGATGTCLPDEYAGFGLPGEATALVCDVGSNLVHRKRLADLGLYWTANRMDESGELLRSTDTWFRPVQLGLGPDGSVYIADMYREVIEHPKSLPPIIKQHLDLTSGRDRGRIYRLCKRENLLADLPVEPLAQLTTEELVDRLFDRRQWQRNMASQLIIERLVAVEDALAVQQQRAVVARQLQAAILQTKLSEGKVIGLHVLARLGGFTADYAAKALRHSSHPRVQEHILLLVGQYGLSDQFAPLLLDIDLHLDEASAARLQLALCQLASHITDTELRSRILSLVMQHVAETDIVRWALAVAAPHQLWKLVAGQVESDGFGDIAGSRQGRTDTDAWVQLLLPSWLDEAATNTELENWLISQMATTDWQRRHAFLGCLAQTTPGVIRQALGLLTDEQTRVLADEVLAHVEATDTASLRLLRLLSADRQLDVVREVWGVELGLPAQDELLALLSYGGAELQAFFIDELPRLTPRQQQTALREILRQPGGLEGVIAQLNNNGIARSMLPLDIRAAMVAIASTEQRSQLSQIFEAISVDRSAVMEKYIAAVDEGAEHADASESGLAVFRRVCSQCHRLGGEGFAVGPDLNQLGSKSPRELVSTILDPNREIDPRYMAYRVLLDDGKALVGLIQDESADQFTLMEAGGKQTQVQRSEIEEIASTGASLMPIGLEQQLTPKEMTDLVTFLRSSRLP